MKTEALRSRTLALLLVASSLNLEAEDVEASRPFSAFFDGLGSSSRRVDSLRTFSTGLRLSPSPLLDGSFCDRDSDQSCEDFSATFDAFAAAADTVTFIDNDVGPWTTFRLWLSVVAS